MNKILKMITVLVTLTVVLALIISCSDDSIVNPVEDPVEDAVLGFDDTLFEFGTAPQNSTISHTFWLYSRGTDTLKILSIQPG